MAAGAVAPADIGIAVAAVEAGEQRRGGRAEGDRLGAGLRVGEPQSAALEVHVLPLEGQDLGLAGAGEEQKPDRGQGPDAPLP